MEMLKLKRGKYKEGKKFLNLSLVFLLLLNSYNNAYSLYIGTHSNSAYYESLNIPLASVREEGNSFKNGEILYQTAQTLEPSEANLPTFQILNYTFPILSEAEGAYDFSRFVMDENLTPSFLQGIDYTVYTDPENPPFEGDAPEQNIFNDIMNFAELFEGMSAIDGSVRKYTVSPEGDYILQQSVEFYNPQTEEKKMAFLYTFYKSVPPYRDPQKVHYIVGFYKYDKEGNLKWHINENGIWFDADFVSLLPSGEIGYELTYSESIGEFSSEAKKFKVSEYSQDGDKNISFNVYIPSEEGDYSKAKQAYHIELNHYNETLDLYEGRYVEIINDITNLEAIKISYSLFLPDENGYIQLMYPPDSNPKDPNNQRNEPIVVYKKATEKGFMSLQFTSPRMISLPEIRGSEFKERIQDMLPEIDDYIFKLYSQEDNMERVYTLYSTSQESSEKSKEFSYYAISNTEDEIKELNDIYEVSEEDFSNLLTAYFGEGNSPEDIFNNFLGNVSEENAFDIKVNEKDRFDSLLGSTQYVWKRYSVSSGREEEERILLTRDIYARTEDGRVQKRSSQVEILNNENFKSLLQIMAERKLLASLGNLVLEREEGEVEGIFQTPFSVTKRSDFMIELDSSGEIINISSYALNSELRTNPRGESYVVWIPDRTSLLQGLKRIAGAETISIGGIEINFEDIIPPPNNPPLETIYGLVYNAESSTLVRIKRRGDLTMLGERLSQLGYPNVVFLEEFNPRVSLNEVQRIGVGFMGKDGQIIKPVFYIHKESEVKDGKEKTYYILTEPVLPKVPYLGQLLEKVGKLTGINKLQEFENAEVIEINIMDDLYQRWDELAFGRSPSGVTLLGEIERAWNGYIRLLENEGKRAGYSVEYDEGSKLLKITKGRKLTREKRLDVLVEGNNSKRMRITVTAEGTPYEEAILFINPDFAGDVPSDLNYDYTEFLAQYYASRKLGNIEDFTFYIDHEFIFDNLKRLRKYIYYGRIQNMPREVFIPYIDPSNFNFLNPDDLDSDAVYSRVLDKNLIDNQQEIEETISELKRDKFSVLRGLYLKRDWPGDPFTTEMEDPAIITELLGGWDRYIPSIFEYFKEFLSLPEGESLKWNEFLKKVVASKNYDLKHVYKDSAGNEKEKIIVDPGDIPEELSETNGRYEVVAKFFDDSLGNFLTGQKLLSYSSTGGNPIITLYGGPSHPVESYKFINGRIEIRARDTLRYPPGLYVYRYSQGTLNSYSEFENLVTTAPLREDVVFQGGIDLEKASEYGVDITKLIPEQGINPVGGNSDASTKIASNAGKALFQMMATFYSYYGLWKTVGEINDLGEEYEELKPTIAQEAEEVLLDYFSQAGDFILQIADIVAEYTGKGEEERGVAKRIPITHVYMLHSSMDILFKPDPQQPSQVSTGRAFNAVLKSSPITKDSFTREKFENWVRLMLGDKITDDGVQFLANAYSYLVGFDGNTPEYGSHPYLFYNLLRGNTPPSGLGEELNRIAWALWSQAYIDHPELYHSEVFKQLTFPLPGDDWIARDGQLNLKREEIRITWSHILSALATVASFAIPPAALMARIGVWSATTGLRIAEAVNLGARGANIISKILSGGAQVLLAAPLGAFRNAVAFVPFTTIMSLQQNTASIGDWAVNWFNGLGGQMLFNALYSYAFGMVFNPSFLGVEIGVGPMFEKIFRGVGSSFELTGNLLGRLGGIMNNSTSFFLTAVGDLIESTGRIFRGIRYPFNWMGYAFNYGDHFAKWFMGSVKTSAGEIARAWFNNPRYWAYMYLTETVMEEELIPAALNWQLKEGLRPERTHLGGSRVPIATLARAQILNTETIGNIAEMTDPVETVFSLGLTVPFYGLFMDKIKEGKFFEFIWDLLTLKEAQ